MAFSSDDAASRRASRSEELDEAFLDLLGPPLELVRIDRENFEVGELRLVRGIRHLGVGNVESLVVGEELLHRFGEYKIGEEPSGRRMRREARDRRGGGDERHAVLRI